MGDEEMGYKIKEMEAREMEDKMPVISREARRDLVLMKEIEVKEKEDKILSVIVILAIGVPGVIALIVLVCLMYEMLGI